MEGRLNEARAALLRGWQHGECPSVEQILSGYADLAADASAVSDLAHVEAVLRQAPPASRSASPRCAAASPATPPASAPGCSRGADPAAAGAG